MTFMNHPISLYYITVNIRLADGSYHAAYLMTSTSFEEAQQKIADYENTDIENCRGRYVCCTDAELFIAL